MYTIRVVMKKDVRPWDVPYWEHKNSQFSIREDIRYLEIYSEEIEGVQMEGTCFYNLDEIERFEVIGGAIMWQMFDDKTDRLVFVGTEKECEEYSKEHSDRKFYMIELKSKENKKDM